MRHFDSENWVDFASQVAPPGQRDAMQLHLETGCQKCSRGLQFWRRVREMAAREAYYQPPESAVRSVKGYYALHKPQAAQPRSAWHVRLILDSLQQPLLQGARSTAESPRQLLYKVGPFLIDVRFEPQGSSDRVSMVGQIIASDRSAIGIQDISVELVNWGGSRARTATNQFGEFHLEAEGSRDLKLSLGIGDGVEILIPVSAAQSPRLPQSSG